MSKMDPEDILVGKGLCPLTKKESDMAKYIRLRRGV